MMKTGDAMTNGIQEDIDVEKTQEIGKDTPGHATTEKETDHIDVIVIAQSDVMIMMMMVIELDHGGAEAARLEGVEISSTTKPFVEMLSDPS